MIVTQSKSKKDTSYALDVAIWHWHKSFLIHCNGSWSRVHHHKCSSLLPIWMLKDYKWWCIAKKWKSTEQEIGDLWTSTTLHKSLLLILKTLTNFSQVSWGVSQKSGDAYQVRQHSRRKKKYTVFRRNQWCTVSQHLHKQNRACLGHVHPFLLSYNFFFIDRTAR